MTDAIAAMKDRERPRCINQTPESIATAAVCFAVGVVCLAGFLATKTTVLSTAAQAMALVINGAR